MIYSFAAILLVQFMVHVMLRSVLNFCDYYYYYCCCYCYHHHYEVIADLLVFKEYRPLTQHYLFIILPKNLQLYGICYVFLPSALEYVDQGAD
jgi:hypothetical protein